ncbi:acetyl-CoA synthetase-like protein [Abortiporus biennis]|nr:acetyl-CoA synthetase-like protein [Abortiporus biennis]
MNSTGSFKSLRGLIEDSTSAYTIPELCDWNAQHNPEHPMFLYSDNESEKDVLKTILWKEAVRGIHRAANSVYTKTHQTPGSSPGPQVIAILAQSDSVTYSCLLLGLLRSSNTAFPISPRNSPEAIAHLLLETHASFLMVGNDAGLWAHAEIAIQKLRELQVDSVPVLLSMTTLEEIFPGPGDDEGFKPIPKVNHPIDATALILHSSGSTAFPKPIFWSHRALNRISVVFGSLDFAGIVVGCHASPIFHTIGIGHLLFSISAGLIMSIFKPRPLPAIPTPDSVFEEAMKTRCQIGVYIPMLLERWSQDPKKVEYLKTMKCLAFGGGPLSKEVGDNLVKAGVRLRSCYGANTTFNLKFQRIEVLGVDWEYLEISTQMPHVFEPREDGTFELVYLQTDDGTLPRVLNYDVKGRNAFSTKDLFVRHPTKPHLWKIFGRSDDQIMLSTGEKTNPGPLEKILIQDPHISNVVIFGRGKFYNGVLVDPLPEIAFDPNGPGGEKSLEQFRHLIWPTVARMNAFAPQHSRLFKEMIIVSLPNKPFMYTAKGTVRRAAVIKEYEPEIEDLYQKVESTANLELNLGSAGVVQEWNFNNTIEFVRKVTLNILEHSVKDEDDFFQHGCDSLQATWIRVQISGMLKRTKSEVANQLPAQCVFQAPSILALTNLILKTIKSVESSEAQGETDIERRVREMVTTIEKYTADIPSRPVTQSLQVHHKDVGDVVLLTGSTGGLGCNMLALLSSDPTVTRIYAFNRKLKGVGSNQVGLRERQMKAVKQRGLEDEYVSSKVVMVEGDLLQPQFGLSTKLYEKMRNSVTHILHNAWPVNFNLNLSSLDEAIHGVRKLVDFAVLSTSSEMPSITFSSSIASVGSTTRLGFAKEEYILDPHVPVGSGYGESKWVAERILAIASERTGLRTTTVRIGQLSGDKTGYWNEKEWVPSLVKSSFFTHCLPVVPSGLVTWLPMYDAAKALIQMRHSNDSILHLVSANPVSWHKIMEELAAQLSVPLVPYDEWLQKLVASLTASGLSEVENMERNPALKLLGFYASATFGGDNNEPIGIIRLDIEKAKKAVPMLQDVKFDVSVTTKKWISAWRAAGYFPDN